MVEVIVVVAILAVLSAVPIGLFVVMQKNADINNVSQEVANVLKLAQNRTLTSENDSQYGVYVNTATSPHQYTLFKGASYASRTASADQIYILPKTVEFYSISLGGGNEIVFDKLTGATLQSGSFGVRIKADTSNNKVIYMSGAGIVSFTAPATIADTRTKDSRHVYFDYSRVINTATENVVLTFNGATVQTIPIATNLVGSQFEWSGTVTAGGTAQTVEVSTLRLNNPDTQFNVHRDMRYNDKTLRITLSGDASGYLADFSANGATTGFTSIYVSNFAWQ